MLCECLFGYFFVLAVHSWVVSLRTIPDIIQLCSGITRGRMFNGELYAERLQMLIYLHLFTDCFMKISLTTPL